jgi:hypothetical protein
MEPRGVEAQKAGEWQSLFDGKTLRGWKLIDGHPFGNHGRVDVRNNEIVLGKGGPCTGIQYTGDLPKSDYEFSFEVMSHSASGGLMSMAFHVEGSSTMASIDVHDGGTIEAIMRVVDGGNRGIAAKARFEKGRWYRVLVQVTQSRLLVLLDDEKLFDWPRPQHSFGKPVEWGALVPFGIGNWDAETSLRRIQVRRIGE